MFHFSFSELWSKVKSWVLIHKLIPEIHVSPVELSTAIASSVEEPVKNFDSGAFYFKKDVLDQLDDYFEVISALKRSDPDAYGFYRKVTFADGQMWAA